MPVIMFVSSGWAWAPGSWSSWPGLQTINTELYEAGKVDGISNPLQEVFTSPCP